jgi:hypothetical protein
MVMCGETGFRLSMVRYNDKGNRTDKIELFAVLTRV